MNSPEKQSIKNETNLKKEIEEMGWIEETINSPNPKSPCPFDEYRIPYQQDVKRKGICKVFCGGKSCKKENWRANGKDNAIVGLNSNWVHPSILASQRLSERILQEYDLINELLKYKSQ